MIRHKKIALTLILVVTLSLSFTSTTYSSTINETVFNKLNKYLSEELPKANVSLASVSIVDNKDVAFSKTYEESISNDSPFIIGSISKSFTALAVMQLVEENKVNLNSPISKYLDEKFIIKEIADNITTRDLLNQTSGITEYSALPITKSNDKSFRYSNANYILLGKIIENTSGMKINDYLQSNIFTPLNMNSTYTSIEKAKKNGFISGHQTFFGIPLISDVYYPEGEIASGYIISSSNDMANYLKLYLNKGIHNGQRIISKDSIESMQHHSVNATGSEIASEMFGGSANYAMGWVHKNINGREIIYHSGKVENSASIAILLPEENLGITMLFNQFDFLVGQNMIEKIEEGVVSILLNENPTSLPQNEYIIKHNIVNLVYFLLILISLMPLILLKRWKQSINFKKISLCKMLSFTLIHIVLPITLLLIFPILGIPLNVALQYVPDLGLILNASLLLLLGTGIYKGLWLLHRRKD